MGVAMPVEKKSIADKYKMFGKKLNGLAVLIVNGGRVGESRMEDSRGKEGGVERRKISVPPQSDHTPVLTYLRVACLVWSNRTK